MHGCITCGKLYQLLVAYDAHGKYLGSKVMSAGGQGGGLMLALHKSLASAHNLQEVDRLTREIEPSADREIDVLVYGLPRKGMIYGLTKEEIGIVEGE